MGEKEKEVLLIEDNANDAELTMLALKKSDPELRVHWMKDGADALVFLREQFEGTSLFEKRVQLILMDLKMPKVNGFELLDAFQSMPQLNTIPKVVLTSSAVESDIQKAYSLGANSYIVKPINYPQHAKAIGEAVSYWTNINKTLY